MIRTLAFTALVLGSFATAQAGTVEWTFQGCEAADVAALVQHRDPAWQGESHAMGPWTLTHTAELGCSDGDCTAGLGMTLAHATLGAARAGATPAPLAFTRVEERMAHSVTLEGDAARSLEANLGPGAFAVGDATRHVVMDYGRIADAVTLRIRTEINCTADGTMCTVEADPLAYIAYDDQRRCGSFATALAPTN